MSASTGYSRTAGAEPLRAGDLRQDQNGLHPAWKRFIQYCQQLGHGELEILRVQDGLPVIAESTTKKVKFT